MHVDDAAASRVGSHGASGLADGTDVYLHPDHYNPSNAEGRALVAHEVTHVAQSQLAVTTAAAHGVTAEVEAHHIGEALARGSAVAAPQVALGRSVAFDKGFKTDMAKFRRVQDHWRPLQREEPVYAFPKLERLFHRAADETSKRAFNGLMQEALLISSERHIRDFVRRQSQYRGHNPVVRARMSVALTALRKVRVRASNFNFAGTPDQAVGRLRVLFDESIRHLVSGRQAGDLAADKMREQTTLTHALSQAGKALPASTVTFLNSAMSTVVGTKWDENIGDALRQQVEGYCDSVGLEKDYADDVLQYSGGAAATPDPSMIVQPVASTKNSSQQ